MEDGSDRYQSASRQRLGKLKLGDATSSRSEEREGLPESCDLTIHQSLQAENGINYCTQGSSFALIYSQMMRYEDTLTSVQGTIRYWLITQLN